MFHYIARIGLLAYLSIVFMALFFLTGTLKNLWVTASFVGQQNEAMIAQMESEFPTLAEELNRIEPAAQ